MTENERISELAEKSGIDVLKLKKTIFRQMLALIDTYAPAHIPFIPRADIYERIKADDMPLAAKLLRQLAVEYVKGSPELRELYWGVMDTASLYLDSVGTQWKLMSDPSRLVTLGFSLGGSLKFKELAANFRASQPQEN